jgi:hypothetical protein
LFLNLLNGRGIQVRKVGEVAEFLEVFHTSLGGNLFLASRIDFIDEFLVSDGLWENVFEQLQELSLRI